MQSVKLSEFVLFVKQELVKRKELNLKLIMFLCDKSIVGYLIWQLSTYLLSYIIVFNYELTMFDICLNHYFSIYQTFLSV